ncbi:MAG: DUF1257 domain-containing protein [Cyanobacteriota bacterium]|nr:DUF1257 domain-containing protein [Cyanobacteriota bacterium]
MSHFSILPTVLRNPELLSSSLRDLGHRPHRGGQLCGFAGERQAVEVWIQLPDGQSLGWRRDPDGSLALVADLQRLSRSSDFQSLLASITRRYAALDALVRASEELPGAVVLLASGSAP